MKIRSAKNKGNRFENFLVEILRENIDKNTHRNYGSGAGLDKADVRIPSLDIEIEAKNCEQINLMKWWEQTERQRTGNNVEVLAIRNPKKSEFEETLIVMNFNDWLDLLKGIGGTKEIICNKDNDLKWAVKNLKEACGKVLKKIEN